MQAPIHILQQEALDISAPLAEGEERQLSMQPQAGNNFAGLFFTGDMDFQWVIDAKTEAQLMAPLPLGSQATFGSLVVSEGALHALRD